MQTLVRIVNEWDAPTMLKLYKHYIETNTCQDEVLPTIAEFVQRIDKYTYGYGWLLAEVDHETAGFCYISENRYDPTNLFSAELQLWVNPKLKLRHVGSALIYMMIGIMQAGNKRELYARIPLPNDEAVGFFKKWGFTEVDTEKDAFEKFGEKYDVLVMHRNIFPEDPEAVRPMKPMIVKLDKPSIFRKIQIEAGDIIK